jgi:FG-GAP repeat
VYVVFGKRTTTLVDLAAVGRWGFRIDGASKWDYARTSAGLGDLNGDGLDDVAVGAPLASPRGRASAGAAYVVYGKRTTSTIHLGKLGAAGFPIFGAAEGDGLGAVAAAGDVNADGHPDIVLGAPRANHLGRGKFAGAAYAVFGREGHRPIDLAEPGDWGFAIEGAHGPSCWHCDPVQAGFSVAGLGDVSGDGLGDVAIGAPGDWNNGKISSGSTYVVFGRTSMRRVDLASLRRGYRIDGAGRFHASSEELAGIGDVNGDDIPDVMVGAPGATYRDREGAGISYVVYGTRDLSTVNLGRLGQQGFRIGGAAEWDSAFRVAPGGDLNGDGRSDLLVSAHLADFADRRNSGAAYVILGRP